jgi:hypothetical protein
MHTHTRLAAGDFTFWQQDATGETEVSFATFCPDYHPQDRIGVVSVALEDGVLHTSYALLAFTTAFYDSLRATRTEFFDYPQHFALVGADANGDARGGATVVHAGGDLLPLATPHLWDAWSWLDVWPEGKWLTAPVTTAALLARVFDYQINRLFWPRALTTRVSEGELPAYVWTMLKTSLKAVYLYGNDGDGGDNGSVGDAPLAALPCERSVVRVRAAAQTLVQESVAKLPAPQLANHAHAIAQAPTTPQSYARVDVAQWLARLGS